MPEPHEEGIWDEKVKIGHPEAVPLEKMDLADLLTLRSDIDALLPTMQLNAINLEEELVRQFQVAKAFQTKILNQTHEEANKKAQVMNTCAATIQALVKMQAEFHTSERLKNIESRLIRCLEKVPAEYLQEFFTWYESEGADLT